MYEPDELEGGCYGCRNLAGQLASAREKVKRMESKLGIDWNLYEASQESLREHMQLLAAAQATIAEMMVAISGADTLVMHCHNEKAREVLRSFIARPTNQDALHEALARECERKPPGTR